MLLLTGQVITEKKIPIARPVADPPFGVLGSVVKLDGRASTDPDGLPLIYSWSFISVPIGSQVGQERFRLLDPDSAYVSFSPDIVGEYILGLTVSNGTFSSDLATTKISIRAIMVPHGRGLVPDGKFIWSYLRDVWSEVENKDWFESLWSALIQIVGSEMLKLYQVDFNKSIRDIQDKFQRRWMSYDPKLDLVEDDLTFYLGNHVTGRGATTHSVGLQGDAVILSSTEVVVIRGAVQPNVLDQNLTITYSQNPANVGTYPLIGTNSSKTGYKLGGSSGPDPVQDRIITGALLNFGFGDTTWALAIRNPHSYAEAFSESGSPMDGLLPLFAGEEGWAGAARIRIGDVIHFPAGPNAGFYRITGKSGTYVVVDKPAKAASDLTVSANIYRPAGFSVSQVESLITDTFSVPNETGDNDLSKLAPGRIVIVGGQAFPIVRSTVDLYQVVPRTLVGVGGNVPTGLKSLNWRAPHTLISKSQNFEALGVCAGDVVLVDVSTPHSNTAGQIKLQVVGVSGFKLGFVITDEPLTPGVVPPIPNHYYQDLAQDLGIGGVTELQDETLVFTGDAKTILDYINSGNFRKAYWNIELSPSDSIKVMGSSFQFHPRAIIRNSFVPVDDSLVSIPLLQEFIKQPELSMHDGKIFQVKGGKEFELKSQPVVLAENSDYLVDSIYALDETVIFNSGTSVITIEGGDFIDRNVQPGDEFLIDKPITISGDYIIASVQDSNTLILSRPVPAYALGTSVSAKVRIKRKRAGHFLRFTPSLFTPKSPAPNRLWAEVSLFDNSDAIENNFGVLVGLKKSDLDAVSKTVSYRQSVAGLMFAYTRGSAVDKVRLGVQILLGLPFAEHRGIIRSIENDYRLDLNGVPVQGRLLIEDIDDSGKLMGTMRVYTFPIDLVSELSGVDVNPATGVTYAVGDTVELFAALAKGVEVTDYISNPNTNEPSAARILQQYHSVKLLANNNIFSLNELDLVSNFLKRITPSYLAYVLSIDTEQADTVSVLDSLKMKLGNSIYTPFIDNVSSGLQASFNLDSKTWSGYPLFNLEDGPISIRKSGLDLSISTDPSTHISTLTIASAGLINPAAGESPLVRVGDRIQLLDGPDAGSYTISAVSDGVVSVSDGPAQGFQNVATQHFIIFRNISYLFRSGSANFTTGQADVNVGGGLRADGIMVGDLLVIAGAHRPYFIINTKKSGLTAYDTVTLDRAPDFTGSANFEIHRPSFYPELLPATYSITSDGTNVTVNGTEFRHLLQIGDELVPVIDTYSSMKVSDTVNLTVVGVLPAGTYSIRVRKNRAQGLGVDWLSRFSPYDVADISLINRSATSINTTAGSSVVQIPTGTGVDTTLPGDLLVISSGSNSAVDVGYGPGTFPIRSVQDSTHLVLSMPVPNTDSSGFKIVRRR